ncbi:hypothetical protein PMSD_15595 [Paenibacillus macquariensis subsp. defensor]|nr:hypothetical protein PMSD_15595 [Paenibacillus macquariensis subsp. defensor]
MINNLLERLDECLDEKEVQLIAKNLHDNYQPFQLDFEVWEMIQDVFPDTVYMDLLEPYKKTIVGHKIVNQIVMSRYFGEKKIKYHFATKYLNREDEVSVFELNVGNSRLDFARFNGHSYAYEIKTELDSLDKLEKQINDYSKVFEYVSVITHMTHYNKVKAMVPEFVGIWTYDLLTPSCKFQPRKKRLINKGIDSVAQIAAMTSKELEVIMKKEGISDIPSDRVSREKLIYLKVNKRSLNNYFKKSIKCRFERRWNFVCENINEIEPIDIQSFFKSTANPYWIYYKNSSMV